TNMDWGRIYLHTDEDFKAEEILAKIFGVTSFSRVIETTSDLTDICKTTAEYARQVIPPKGTFAVRARRAGDHAYSSQDVAREAGSAILSANEDMNLKVNLSQPDIELFVEVRHNRTFIFSEKQQGPGGFPLGTQGKVLAVISDKKSVYAAWLMMKRGCTLKVLCTDEDALTYAQRLKLWNLGSQPKKVQEESNLLDAAKTLAKKARAQALVLGHSYKEFESAPKIQADIPIFYPLIGMSKEEIERKITSLFGDDWK
ncbi:MAG: hypothetical protein JSW28_06270, partial [Thermoplasmata archaeon]